MALTLKTQQGRKTSILRAAAELEPGTTELRAAKELFYLLSCKILPPCEPIHGTD